MAKITDIQKCSRLIRPTGKTVAEVNYDSRYFSIWARTAGAEAGNGTAALDLQLDRRAAQRLRDFLDAFLTEKEPG